jgi:hypothetical protein
LDDCNSGKPIESSAIIEERDGAGVPEACSQKAKYHSKKNILNSLYLSNICPIMSEGLDYDGKERDFGSAAMYVWDKSLITNDLRTEQVL